MTESDSENEPTPDNEPDAIVPPVPAEAAEEDDDGPGWLPAILAGTLLLGILGFICCGVSTWVLFQKRTEFAVRTLKGSYLPQLEQSLLQPEEKLLVVRRVKELATDMERGKYEQWQAAGIMQRLQRLPVVQWGELEAVDGHIRKSEAEDRSDSLQELSRLRRGVELGKVTSFDFEDVLKPVMEADAQSSTGRRLVQPLTDELVKEVIKRAKLVSDRSEVPNKSFDVSIDEILSREIELGKNEGGF